MKLASDRKLIYDLNLDELTAEFESWDEPSYRGRQVWDGLYKNIWNDPNDFSNIPIQFRDRLANHFAFKTLTSDIVKDSKNGMTRKILFRTQDKLGIEAVLMRYETRNTLCISTQAGCAMGCTFCATGQMGFMRNLSSGEIIEQVLHYTRQLKHEGKKVTNIVLMGMGEPFHNYEPTMEAIKRLNREDGLNLGARRFTVSTVGIVPGIRRFAAEGWQVNLAISLHATEDELRSSMIPINKKYPIMELMEACRDYVNQTGRRITIEWALIQGVNDSSEQANKLAELLKGLLCHVNVIPLNPTEKFTGKRSSRSRVNKFKDVLESQGISCTIRLRRGIEIHAGCGQLATTPN